MTTSATFMQTVIKMLSSNSSLSSSCQDLEMLNSLKLEKA